LTGDDERGEAEVEDDDGGLRWSSAQLTVAVHPGVGAFAGPAFDGLDGGWGYRCGWSDRESPGRPEPWLVDLPFGGVPLTPRCHAMPLRPRARNHPVAAPAAMGAQRIRRVKRRLHPCGQRSTRPRSAPAGMLHGRDVTLDNQGP